MVKSRRTKYLPPPPGIPVSSNELLASTSKRTTEDQYSFYLSFAEFPEIVEPALTGFQGIIHAREPMVSLPEKMQYLLEDATPDGDDLVVLWQRVTREILSGGRVGLLGEVSEEDDLVKICSYAADSITNWKELPKREGGGASFVVLLEIRDMPVRSEGGGGDPFSTEPIRFWRELRLNATPDGPVYQVRMWREVSDEESVTTEGSDRAHSLSPVPVRESSAESPPRIERVDGREWTTITLFNTGFPRIPFVCINALDDGFKYGAIPMLPLTRRAYSIYRLTADYRRALYQKGDPQPYISGIPKEDAPKRIGGEKLWTFENPDAKAAYLDVEGDGGIPMMRVAIQDDFVRFDQEGGRLLSTTMRPESGDALKARLLAHQVTLRNVVINAGRGMQKMLRVVAVMLGEDPAEVVFTPDLDFAEPVMDGQTALEWAQAKRQGYPVSERTLHKLAHRGGVTEKTWEEEREEIEEERQNPLAEPEEVPDEGSAQSQPKETEPV